MASYKRPDPSDRIYRLLEEVGTDRVSTKQSVFQLAEGLAEVVADALRRLFKFCSHERVYCVHGVYAERRTPPWAKRLHETVCVDCNKSLTGHPPVCISRVY